MPNGNRRRALVVAVAVAAVLGFLVGWFARMWTAPSPESRARERVEEMRERVRQLTR